jgi:hypothetical protein
MLQRTGESYAALRRSVNQDAPAHLEEARALASERAEIEEQIARVEADAGPRPLEPRIKAGRKYREFLAASQASSNQRAPLRALEPRLHVIDRRLRELHSVRTLEQQTEQLRSFEASMADVRIHTTRVAPLIDYLAAFDT